MELSRKMLIINNNNTCYWRSRDSPTWVRYQECIITCAFPQSVLGIDNLSFILMKLNIPFNLRESFIYKSKSKSFVQIPWHSLPGSFICSWNITPGRYLLRCNVPMAFEFMCCIFFKRNNWIQNVKTPRYFGETSHSHSHGCRSVVRVYTPWVNAPVPPWASFSVQLAFQDFLLFLEPPPYSWSHFFSFSAGFYACSFVTFT